MSILESINSPADLRALPPEQLRTVADEIRNYILETMSRVGGHTGASLGAVELAVALHYAFDTPRDRLVWDVGHQAYAHKILTGRRELLPTIKQYGGCPGIAAGGGMAREAVNKSGHLKPRLLVPLKDNERSLAPAVGALTGYLNRIREAQ